MNKVSSELWSTAQFIGEEKAMQLFKDVGFDYFDIHFSAMASFDFNNNKLFDNNHPWKGDNYVEYVKSLRAMADKIGIKCNQSHAPFPIDHEDVKPFLERAIHSTYLMGGKTCVVHPDLNKSVEENAKIFKELLKTAHKYNINVAVENVFNWDFKEWHALESASSNEKNLLKMVELVDDPLFKVCVDFGHAALNGLDTSAAKIIRALKDKVVSLHIHDNDFTFDNHFMPFTRNIDFEDTAKALKEINYQGELTLETIYFLNDYKDNLPEGLKIMKETVDKFAKMVDEA